MLRSTKVDMLSGSVFKGLLSMTIPIMIMNVMQNMFSLIDMTVLGKFADDGAVGAVGACSTLISLCTGLFIGVSTGANVTIAKCIGAGDKERSEKAVGTALFFAVIGGLVLMATGFFGAETFLSWINCPESLLDNAALYFKIYFLGSPLILLYNFCASILRAAGDTKRPMYFLLIGGAVKVILNYFCITRFEMTVDGVGIATVVSNGIAGFLALFTLLKSKEKVVLSPKRFRFYYSELGDMLEIGIPTGIQTALYSLANTVILKAVNGFGPDATTGLSIANQFDGILYQISIATAFAATPYIAQNIGARNPKRAKKALYNSILITVMFGAGFGALSAIFSPQLSGIMSDTPAVIEYSCQKMIIISSTYFICGINEVFGGALRGLGRPVIPTVATLIFMCAIRFFWVYLVFPLCPNLTFLYLIWPIGWILSILTLLSVYIPTMRKLSKQAI